MNIKTRIARGTNPQRLQGRTKSDVGFINMQAGWNSLMKRELGEQLREEKLMAYHFEETHLRIMEKPPGNPKYAWDFYNKKGESRNRSGIGTYIDKSTAWQRAKHKGRKNLLLKEKVARRSLSWVSYTFWEGQKPKRKTRSGAVHQKWHSWTRRRVRGNFSRYGCTHLWYERIHSPNRQC